jgi:hypothetical protein
MSMVIVMGPVGVVVAAGTAVVVEVSSVISRIVTRQATRVPASFRKRFEREQTANGRLKLPRIDLRQRME